MEKLFEVLFLEDALKFLKSLEPKHYQKVLFNIRKAQIEQNVSLFKKINNEFWEFRSLYAGKQYRLLAFWDKTLPQETLVIVTHGFIKKRSKISEQELKKALRIKNRNYLGSPQYLHFTASRNL